MDRTVCRGLRAGYRAGRLAVIGSIVLVLGAADCRSRLRPEAPELYGPSRIAVGADCEFKAIVLGRVLQYRFYWGSGDTSTWSEFSDNGKKETHQWSTTETFFVTAQARDSGGRISDWSAPVRTCVGSGQILHNYRFGAELTTEPVVGVGPHNKTYVSGNASEADRKLYEDSLVLGETSPGSGDVISILIAQDERMYLGTHSNRILVWDAALDSGVTWCEMTHATKTLPALGLDGTYYVGNGLTFLCAYVQGDSGGKLKWAVELDPAETLSSPVVNIDSSIWFGTDDGFLRALKPDGSELWSCPVSGSLLSPLAIGADGTLYAGSMQGVLYAVVPQQGVAWTFEAGGAIRSSPVVAADGTVYFGSDDGCLYAVRPDGRQKWVYPTSHPIRKSPALSSDGLVYFNSEDWYLRAVDTSGALVWDCVVALYTGSPAIAPDGVVWLTTGEGLVGITCQGQLADAPWPMYRHDLRHTACAVR